MQFRLDGCAGLNNLGLPNLGLPNLDLGLPNIHLFVVRGEPFVVHTDVLTQKENAGRQGRDDPFPQLSQTRLNPRLTR